MSVSGCFETTLCNRRSSWNANAYYTYTLSSSKIDMKSESATQLLSYTINTKSDKLFSLSSGA